jgi:WD40 repeat protein
MASGRLQISAEPGDFPPTDRDSPAASLPTAVSAPPRTHAYPTRRPSARARRAAAAGRRPSMVSRWGNRRKEDERLEEKRRAMLAAEAPTGVVELAGHGEEEWFHHIVPLPGGDRVAIANFDGEVRVFAVATGALELELVEHVAFMQDGTLAALGGDIIVTGGYDGKVITWNSTSGERLGEGETGGRVRALAALDGGRFVAGTRYSDIVFYTHHDGRRVEEAARIQGGGLYDLAVCGGRLATASAKQKVTVWNIDSREQLARLSGHTDSVRSVDMNYRLVVTASWDHSMRVYNAAGDYSCIAVLDWIHTDYVRSVTLLGDNHILSASCDHTVCVTQLSSSTVIARTQLSYFVCCAAVLPDGRLAVCGDCGGRGAGIIDAPPGAADILKAHGAAAFPEAVTAASAEPQRRKEEERRDEECRAMPVPGAPTGVVELAVHGPGELLWCIVPLPRGDRVATASNTGKVRVFAVATGALAHELDAHEGDIGWRALTALGGDIIVSAGDADGKVVTWNAAGGERLDEAAVGSDVGALAALGPGRFVAGTAGGDVVFCTHHGGLCVEEVARIAAAHSRGVLDFAVRGGLLATASSDRTAAVWNLDSRERLATLSGHTNSVSSVDMNDQLVVTASWDKTVRVYNAERDYSCTAVLDWLHTNSVNSVTIVGDDHILSASDDHTVCVTQLSSSTVVARTKLSFEVECAAALPDGRLAVCCGGNAALIDEPGAAADILQAAYPEAAAASSALAVAEPLPPLQDAVVRVAAGEQTAAAACRVLISADACSVSFAEWNAAHLLLMRAVRDGEVEGSSTFNGTLNFWFDNLYVPSRKFCLGAEDYYVIKRQLEQAKDAGVIEMVEATLAAIHVYLDLQDGVHMVRRACEQILSAVSFLFFEQAQLDRRLSSIGAELHRVKRFQLIASLGKAVFGLIPFAGAAVAGSFAGAASLFEALDSGSAIESILGAGADARAFATKTLVDRFLYGGRLVLKAEVLAQMTVGQRRVLEGAAAGLGMSIDNLRRMIVDAIGDADAPTPPVLGANDGTSPAEDVPESVYREAVAALLGVDDRGTGTEKFETELNILKKRGVTAELVLEMDHAELAVSMAAHMVSYEQMWLSQFVRLRSRLMELLFEQTVSGSLLVGYHAIPPGKFLEHVVNGLNASDACRPTLGQEAALRRFLYLLHGECQ